MPKARCPQHNCEHLIEVEHWDDALAKVQAHYRLEHPTKVFYRTRLETDYDNYNKTLQEWFADYHPGVAIDTLSSRTITNRCTRLVEAAYIVNPDTVQEAILLAAEHGVQLSVSSPLPTPVTRPDYNLIDSVRDSVMCDPIPMDNGF